MAVSSFQCLFIVPTMVFVSMKFCIPRIFRCIAVRGTFHVRKDIFLQSTRIDVFPIHIQYQCLQFVPNVLMAPCTLCFFFRRSLSVCLNAIIIFSVCQSVYLSVCLPVCLSVCSSICGVSISLSLSDSLSL